MLYRLVADPDLQIRVGEGEGGGGGGGHPDPEIRWGPVSKIFWPFAPQCGLEIRRGDPPLDPPLPSVL